MTVIVPDLPRRSPVSAHRRASPAPFATSNSIYSSNARSQDGVSSLTLIDMSLLPRWGLKGRGALAWLGEQGVAIPQYSNRSALQHDGALVAQLSASELLILSSATTGTSAAGKLIESLPPAGAKNCYPAPRMDSHAWFLLRGHDTPRLFAKLCGIDLHQDQFKNFRVTQTNVARLSAIVIRNDTANVPAFSLLADTSSAEYLWECLADAMSEFDGSVVSVDSQRTSE